MITSNFAQALATFVLKDLIVVTAGKSGDSEIEECSLQLITQFKQSKRRSLKKSGLL